MITNVPYRRMTSACRFRFEDGHVYVDEDSSSDWITLTINNENIYMPRTLFNKVVPKIDLDDECDTSISFPCKLNFDAIVDSTTLSCENALPALLFTIAFGNAKQLQVFGKELERVLPLQTSRYNRDLCKNFTQPLCLDFLCKVLSTLKSNESRLLFLDSIVFDKKFPWDLTDSNTRDCLHMIMDIVGQLSRTPTDHNFLKKLRIVKYIPASFLLANRTLDADEEEDCTCEIRQKQDSFKRLLENCYKKELEAGAFEKIQYREPAAHGIKYEAGTVKCRNDEHPDDVHVSNENVNQPIVQSNVSQ